MIRYKGYEPRKDKTKARKQPKNANKYCVFAKEKPKPITFVFDLGFDWRKRRDSSDEPFGGLKEIQLNLFLQKLFFPHLGHLNFLFVKVCVPKIKSFIDGTNFSPQFGHS